MKLIRLACAAGVVLVSGGCAERLTAPPAMASRSTAPSPSVIRAALFVVDGRILDNDAEVKEIDPATIDRVEVLKGATAVQRFGERGANGVVLITLKQAS